VDFPAKTSRSPDGSAASTENAAPSGSTWLEPFAYYNPDSCSSRTFPDWRPRWVPVQGSLLSEPSSPIWPKQGTWDHSYAYELLTSEPPISANGSSCLLPTPAANDDGKTPEQHLEMKANLPGGPRYMITSLAVLARAGFEQPNLLPTPGANDSTGAEGPTREARQERTRGGTGGPSLRDIQHLLPTPTSGDSKSSGSRNLEGSSAHAGVSLTDAILFGNSTTPRLLPTPTGDDANNNGGPAQHERNSLPLNTVAALLPTPMANPDNPGAGGELRAAITHGPGRRNETGVDTWRRPNRGRSLGASTDPPSNSGSASSDDPHPFQLTFEDA
jgi:hypothetical protein